MNPDTTSNAEPAISPADVAAIWKDLWSWVRFAEGSRDEAWDSEERYLCKVKIDAAYRNLADFHVALAGPGHNRVCQEADCTHLTEGITADRLDVLLGGLDAAIRNNKGKLQDPRLSSDGHAHLHQLERLRDDLLKRRRG